MNIGGAFCLYVCGGYGGEEKLIISTQEEKIDSRYIFRNGDF